jgi:predicted methyltransferase
MDARAYNSQQEAITRKAKKKGIALEVLNAVFDQKIDAIVHDYPGTSHAWRLGRAEYL